MNDKSAIAIGVLISVIILLVIIVPPGNHGEHEVNVIAPTPTNTTSIIIPIRGRK